MKISRSSRCFILWMTMVLHFSACESEKKGFKLCGSQQLWPYYHPELKNQKSFYQIKNYFFTNYRVVSGRDNNGIVKIRFHVNCEGESGNFEVENYGLDYKEVKLSEEINRQLLELTKQIGQWVPAKDSDGETVNSHKFYAFRVEKGQITDILPK